MMRLDVPSFIEIFKTNVVDLAFSIEIRERIELNVPGTKAHFDLEDCDKILRVEFYQSTESIAAVLAVVQQLGVKIEVLEDKIF